MQVFQSSSRGVAQFHRSSAVTARTALSVRKAAPVREHAAALQQQAQQQLQARAKVVMHGTIEKINGEQLEVLLAEREKAVIVDFFATWCGPCVLLAQELEKVAAELGDKVKIVKIDVDQEQGLSSQLQIQGLPTMVFVPKTGIDKPALRTEGLLPAAQIVDIVTPYL